MSAPLIPADQSITLAQTAFLAFDFDESSWFVGNEWIGKDRRGEADPRRSAIWSRTSRVSCAFKAIGGKPALKIRRNAHVSVQSTIIKDMMGGTDSSEAYDLFLAWRCGCLANTEVVYPTLADVPTETGYHGACPRCGQAPLEILVPERKLAQLALLPTEKDTA